MLYIINDTEVTINDKAYASSQGGSSTYVAGFINQLISSKINFGLIGNYKPDHQTDKCYFIKGGSNARFMLHLAKFFITHRKFSDDILYFHRPDYAALSVVFNSFRVIHLHGQPRSVILSGRKFLKRQLFLFFENISMRIADLIIVTDEKSYKVYLDKYPFLSAKMYILPTGIDTSFFSSEQSAVKKTTENSKYLVVVGRLAYPKRIADIIESFAIIAKKYGNLFLYIVGDGPLMNYLKQLSTDNGLNERVIFTGQLSKVEVRDIISKCDASVLLSEYEGSPISVKEILASGKPVVVNDVGDLKDYITHGKNGYFVNPDDHQEVSKAMMDAVFNSSDMKEYCISSMSDFTESNINERVLSLISEKSKH